MTAGQFQPSHHRRDESEWNTSIRKCVPAWFSRRLASPPVLAATPILFLLLSEASAHCGNPEPGGHEASEASANTRRVHRTNAIKPSVAGTNAGARDWPEWGGSSFRNNISNSQNIPIDWDIGDARNMEVDRRAGQVPPGSRNIKWVVPLGSQTYGNPVVANGRIFVGTNNGAAYLSYYPSSVDLGVMLCFEEKTGRFLWQHSNLKLPTGRVHDWPLQGVCSTPVVRGDRLWYVSNRGEVVCLDTEGFYDDEDDGLDDTIGAEDSDENWIPCFTMPVFAHQDIKWLSGELRRAGIKTVRGWRLKEDSAGWTIGRFNREQRKNVWRPTYALRRTGRLLRIFAMKNGKADLRNQLLQLPDSLLPGLSRGQIDESLRDEFGRAGATLSTDAVLKPVVGDSEWTVDGTMFGLPQEFRLTLKNERLHCTRLRKLEDRYEADVVWKLDMMGKLGVSQHNMANCSMLHIDGRLFVCTSNGLDESHLNLPAPNAPSFLALDAETGDVLWADGSPGRNILHAQWASPAYGVFKGQPQVIFPGGDGWVYSFDPAGDGQGNSRLVWKFDANPKTSQWILGGRGTRNNIIAFPVIYDGMVYITVGQDPEHGEGPGRLWCIDPARHLDGSDVSAELAVNTDGEVIPHRRVQAVNTATGEKAIPNPASAVTWCYKSEDRDGDGEIDFEEEFHRSLSAPVIKDDILYIADFGGLFHCLDAKTGSRQWIYDTFAACWGSALLVDGHVYMGDEDGDVAVFKHSADQRIAMQNGEPITTPVLNSSVYMTPIAADNVLYIASKNCLFAVEAD